MSNTKRKVNIVPYLLIIPALILILVFKIFPILSTLAEGFIIDDIFTFEAYSTVFNDPTFYNSLWVTIKLNIVIIPLQILISFVLAMLANLTLKGIGAYRTVFYLPFTISLTVATIIWSMMFNANNGIINSIIGLFGIPSQDFLLSETQALWCIVVIASWKGCGYWMMFILAGLKNIDHSIYESAKIDGAGFWTTISRITLPLLKRILLFVCVANTTANVLLFAPMQMLTNGGPQGSTNVLMFEAYQSAFRYGNRPRSAVMVTVLLILIIIVCIFQFKLLNEKTEDR